MGANFKHMGPACCCCNHLYSSSQTDVYIFRHVVKDGTLQLFPPSNYGYDKSDQWFKMDFDPVHKKVFVSLRGVVGDNPRQRISKLDDDFTNEVQLTSVTAGVQTVLNLTSDSDNERVYFIVRDVPSTQDRYLHVVNHDGTGAGLVGPLTNNSTGENQHAIQYCRTNGKIYYCSFDSTPEKCLYVIDADGTNDTLLASPSQAPVSAIQDVTVDNTGQKVWWIEQSSTIGNSMMIWKADLDGTNATAVVTLDPNDGNPALAIWGLQWSHKNQRIYWWQQDNLLSYGSDTTNGWFSAAIDGTDIQLECSRDQEWRFTVPEVMRLGCQWEETGANSPA